jgi:hypothetical protein
MIFFQEFSIKLKNWQKAFATFIFSITINSYLSLICQNIFWIIDAQYVF